MQGSTPCFAVKIVFLPEDILRMSCRRYMCIAFPPLRPPIVNVYISSHIPLSISTKGVQGVGSYGYPWRPAVFWGKHGKRRVRLRDQGALQNIESSRLLEAFFILDIVYTVQYMLLTETSTCIEEMFLSPRCLCATVSIDHTLKASSFFYRLLRRDI